MGDHIGLPFALFTDQFHRRLPRRCRWPNLGATYSAETTGRRRRSCNSEARRPTYEFTSLVPAATPRPGPNSGQRQTDDPGRQPQAAGTRPGAALNWRQGDKIYLTGERTRSGRPRRRRPPAARPGRRGPARLGQQRRRLRPRRFVRGRVASAPGRSDRHPALKESATSSSGNSYNRARFRHRIAK